MLDYPKFTEFEWDLGNIDKNYQKHRVTQKEAEELFLDPNVLFLEDVAHSLKEKRYIAIGKNSGNKVFFSVITIRKTKIRIISVRIANKKERRRYEKTT